MFRDCQRAQCGWNMSYDRGKAGVLGGDWTVGEAEPGPVQLVTLKVSRSNSGFSEEPAYLQIQAQPSNLSQVVKVIFSFPYAHSFSLFLHYFDFIRKEGCYFLCPFRDPNNRYYFQVPITDEEIKAQSTEVP